MYEKHWMKNFKKCEGLPLVIRKLTDLLRCELNQGKWENIKKNNV